MNSASVKVANSILSFCYLHSNAVKFFAHLNLTGKTAVFPDVKSEIQDVTFQFICLAALARPIFGDIDMAGGTGAETATIAFDTRHQIVQGSLHQ